MTTTIITVKDIEINDLRLFFQTERVCEANYLFPTYDVETISYAVRMPYKALYGAFIETVMCGYCLVSELEKSLDLIYVSNRFRRCGIGSSLISYTGARTVSVNEENKAAIALYSKLGMTVSVIRTTTEW